MTARKDITGEKFGRLEVISLAFSDKHNTWHWNCKCDCGRLVTVSGCNLRIGATRSCGCFVSENARIASKTHGECYTQLYHVWEKIKARCNNPNEKSYKNYGGRGIKICEEWLDYISFRDWAKENGYEAQLTIDRIDNNLGYFPGNCRWVTNAENQKNKRNTRFVTFRGKIKTLSDWARILEIPYSTLFGRLYSCGWSVEEAFSAPPRKYGNK